MGSGWGACQLQLSDTLRTWESCSIRNSTEQITTKYIFCVSREEILALLNLAIAFILSLIEVVQFPYLRLFENCMESKCVFPPLSHFQCYSVLYPGLSNTQGLHANPDFPKRYVTQICCRAWHQLLRGENDSIKFHVFGNYINIFSCSWKGNHKFQGGCSDLPRASSLHSSTFKQQAKKQI